MKADDRNAFFDQNVELLMRRTEHRTRNGHRAETELRVISGQSFGEARAGTRIAIERLGVRREQIDVERPIRALPDRLHGCAQPIRRRAGGAEAAESACLAHRRHELSIGGARHGRLDDGVLDVEKIEQFADPATPPLPPLVNLPNRVSAHRV